VNVYADNPKSEIRNPKSEIRSQLPLLFGFRISDFGFRFVVFALLVIAAGCGGRREATPVNLEGVVKFEDQKPVPEMILNLHPQDAANQNNRPTDLVSKGGSFKMKCLPGKYKVTVAPIPKQGGSAANNPAPAPGQPVVSGTLFPGDADYRDTQKTPWIIDVPPDGQTDLVLTIKKK
jgi:hypothetical protein